MPIKITKQEKKNERGDDLYTAEVTTQRGTWESPCPLPSVELDSELIGMGFRITEIDRAFQEAGVDHSPDATYRYAAKVTRSFLQATLAGEREVPEQELFTEGWLAYALYSYEGLGPLDEVLGWADARNHAVPEVDEVSWAFLRLRKRGWLAIDGEMYGLTPEAHRTVKEIVDKDEPPWPDWSYEQWTHYVKTGRPVIGRTWALEKLKDWISENPPPGDD